MHWGDRDQEICEDFSVILWKFGNWNQDGKLWGNYREKKNGHVHPNDSSAPCI